MRQAPLAAVAVALTLAASLTPASAAPSTPGNTDALVQSLTSSPRVTPGAQARTLSPKVAAVTPNAIPVGPYDRISGANRYATAVEVSKALVCSPDTPTLECWGLGGVDFPVMTVFVASGTTFPDALGAGPLAAGIGPLLLVPPTGTIPAVVTAEIARINPAEIVIFGGPSAVSADVEAQLGAYALTSRIAGANRYDTSAQVALINDEVWKAQDQDGDGVPEGQGLATVVLATGAGFADSLAGGGAAANMRGSLLLTSSASLPDETLAALVAIQPPEVIILGGPGAVSDAVEQAVVAALPTSSVTRVFGADRFETANQLSQYVYPVGTMDVFVVNGYNFPDALASAPLAGIWGASTLLAKASCVPAATRAEASRLDPIWVTGFGGTTVLSDEAIALTSC